ncbi:MAG TPA: helix-turn-helix transcriptional regulator [Bacteroidales bacterium]|nr:helix-turn-helix transcriptional regulator [Bacteroidales bacterium]HPS18299.1 helix-turn-helix transcriptional regulator [Bacteroidales bacterium]
MNERIQLILKTKNISASKFADEIGVQRSSISHIISGRNNPSLDFIQKIIKRFPDINYDWLIFGKGSIYKEQDLFSDIDDKNGKTKVNEQIINPESDIFTEINEHTSEIQDDNAIVNENDISDKKPEPVKKVKQVSEILRETKKPSVETKALPRKIERIIIFYSDKTCAEYKLE